MKYECLQCWLDKDTFIVDECEHVRLENAINEAMVQGFIADMKAFMKAYWNQRDAERARDGA